MRLYPWKKSVPFKVCHSLAQTLNSIDLVCDITTLSIRTYPSRQVWGASSALSVTQDNNVFRKKGLCFLLYNCRSVIFCARIVVTNQLGKLQNNFDLDIEGLYYVSGSYFQRQKSKLHKALFEKNHLLRITVDLVMESP